MSDTDHGLSSQGLCIKGLNALRTRLSRTIEKDIRPKLADARISSAVRTALKEQMKDLEKTIREIESLETRLERL